MKRALALALMATGITCAGNAPSSAAAGALPGVAAPLAQAANAGLIRAGFDHNQGCWWDVPVVNAGVAFFQLLRDEEPITHCDDYPYDSTVVGEPEPIAPLHEGKAYRKGRPKKSGDYLPPK
jgi:hypothetical protein